MDIATTRKNRPKGRFFENRGILPSSGGVGTRRVSLVFETLLRLGKLQQKLVTFADDRKL